MPGGLSPAVLKPVTFTFVEYEEGDALGKLLAYISLLPVFIGFGFGVAIICRRELTTMAVLVGLILDERVNAVLKGYFQEPRPTRGVGGEVWSEYGMPSSHTQFMFFFATFGVLWLFRAVKSKPTPVLTKTTIIVLKCIVAAGLYIGAAVVGFSRSYLRYHTEKQVVVGAAVGCLSGAVWYMFTFTVLVATFFPWFENTWLANVFLIKDSTPIDDILLFEYNAQRKHKEQLHAGKSQ